MKYWIILLPLLLICGCGKEENPTGPDPTPDPGDQEKPYVEILYPEHGQSISQRSIRIRVAASDDKGIRSVEIWIDGQSKCYLRNSPWNCNVDNLVKGEHRIAARATDTSNKYTTDHVTFSVWW